MVGAPVVGAAVVGAAVVGAAVVVGAAAVGAAVVGAGGLQVRIAGDVGQSAPFPDCAAVTAVDRRSCHCCWSNCGFKNHRPVCVQFDHSDHVNAQSTSGRAVSEMTTLGTIEDKEVADRPKWNASSGAPPTCGTKVPSGGSTPNLSPAPPAHAILSMQGPAVVSWKHGVWEWEKIQSFHLPEYR